jgi:hypothetical protein
MLLNPNRITAKVTHINHPPIKWRIWCTTRNAHD